MDNLSDIVRREKLPSPSQDQVDSILRAIAAGYSEYEISQEVGVDYLEMLDLLTSTENANRLTDARKASIEVILAKCKEISDKMEQGILDEGQARVMISAQEKLAKIRETVTGDSLHSETLANIGISLEPIPRSFPDPININDYNYKKG